MLMLPHATGLPGAASQLLKRTSKSFIFSDVLLHGQEILTMQSLPLSKALEIEPVARVDNGLAQMGLLLCFQEGSVLFGGQFFTDSLSLQNECNALQLSSEA